MKTIKLSNRVIVSDPCYDLDVSCKYITDKMCPGEYDVSVEYSSDTSWGKRVATLTVEHKDYKSSYLPWEETSNDIGVDSGQCGIFNLEEYRNDEKSKEYNLPLAFGPDWSDNDGDDWYQRMCTLTLSINDCGVSNNSWGTVETGVVSSSGYGDGVYKLFSKKTDNDVIVGFLLVFLNI